MYKKYLLILNVNKGEELIDYIEKQPNKNEFIKACILEHLKKAKPLE